MFFGDEHDQLSRRDFLKFSSKVALSSALCPSLSSCIRKPVDKEPVLKIGYLPITDATPLLIGHAKGFFEEEGLRVERPSVFMNVVA